MRTDDRAFKLEKRAKQTSLFTFDMGRFGGTTVGASQSGSERNRLFANEQVGQDERFVDVSGISGIDSAGDGRSFAVWDFDRDGWLDVALVGANAPLLQVFHNELERAAPDAARQGKFVALRFRGGNGAAAPTDEWSARDAFGTKVTLHLGDLSIVREQRCGEGLAAQNSATMLIGIGDREVVPSIDVRWPSGRVDTIASVESGTLVTLHENASTSPNGKVDVREAYVRPRAAPPQNVEDPEPAETLSIVPSGAKPATLTMYTTMATTCVACYEELPDLAELRHALGPEKLRMYGVPAARFGGPDGTLDGADALAEWERKFSPVYELLIDANEERITALSELVERAIDYVGYSATVVTDGAARVILVRQGAPTLSELKRLLRAQ